VGGNATPSNTLSDADAGNSPRFIASQDTQADAPHDLVPDSADCGDLLPFADALAAVTETEEIETNTASVSTDDSFLLARNKPVL
jgi:hypothetical protein